MRGAIARLSGAVLGGSAVPAALLASVVASVVAWQPSPSEAQGRTPTCNGLRATIVGAPEGDFIEGTAGDDVIVSRGGGSVVFGHGGDDTICTGAGSDWIETGPGDDVVRSGAGPDKVFSQSGAEWIGSGSDQDTIEVTALEGVTIRARSGDDEVSVTTSSGVPVSLVGGAGQNLLTLDVDDSGGSTAITLDRAQRTMSVGGPSGAYAGWSGGFFGGGHDWTYVGNDAMDDVTFNAGRVTVNLAGGDDLVFALEDGAHYADGGEGNDYSHGIGDEDDVCISIEFGDCASLE